ncbi:DUF1911 domain-containing protein [Pseudoalteromonas sp. CNC9-20]|uniref:PoNe immunity protein domain-containing protein n=1 Tax=Pseudoalteromonas sp. CNC9-20 TaxID=2917750 RepID=UPI001EF5F20F|nr:PoNe immunity protein domain-containing protein [Pseudoalteromonas sp. CNC9-20]MCG7569413.1 DUF1911 domain-containing protein [Pseudoalteromonas sp. CNC9-20]
MRDTRKDKAYFEGLVIDFEEALTETQEALDAGNFSTPSSRVDISLRLFQLSIMRAVAHYSYGTPLEILKQLVLEILPYRKQVTFYADKLPAVHQVYRYAFEQLGDVGEACGSYNINRYIYTLWWLSLLNACDIEKSHILDALKTIGEQGKDKLLDCIAIELGDKNRPMSQSLYYPEVYQNLSDAFSSDKNKQVTLLNKFIENWYEKLEVADWHGNHECSLEFEYTDYYTGYWSFEHALVADLLKIPKHKLNQHPMVAFDLIKNGTLLHKAEDAFKLESLPDLNNLNLHDIAEFTLNNNPNTIFKKRWQDNYVHCAMGLWQEIRKCYTEDKKCNFSPQELLFAINYEYAVQPYRDSSRESLAFFKWCFENLKTT